MLSPSDFNNAVPQFTNGDYASNPINPQYIAEPGAEDYNRGTEPLQTLPAQWWNWFLNRFTNRFNKVNIYVKNIFNELTQLLSLVSVSPSGTEGTPTVGQLKDMFENKYPSYLALLMYPVGSIYWTGKAPDDGGDPNELFGGTWVQIKGKFVWAKGDGDTLNATGGSKTVTLTKQQIPSHTHTFTGSAVTSGANNRGHTHSVTAAGTVSKHTHTIAHTHSVTAAGTVSKHTHSVGAHTHGLNSHTHSFSGSASHEHKLAYSWTPSTTTNKDVVYYFNGHPRGVKGIGNSQGMLQDHTDATGTLNVNSATVSISGTTGQASGNTDNSTAFNSGETQPTFTGTAVTSGASSATNSGESTPTFTGSAVTSGAESQNHTHSVTASGTNSYTGGGQAHDNMPPYIVKYCWERTA